MAVDRDPALRRSGQAVTIGDLFKLALAPPIRLLRRRMLQARIRSLHGLAEYFEWQEANGRAGLADTHKRMAPAESELNALHIALRYGDRANVKICSVSIGALKIPRSHEL